MAFNCMIILENKKINDLIEKIVRDHGVKGDYKVNVYEVTEREMRDLDKKWMTPLHQKASEGHGKLHDVLSFPLEKELGPDGVMRLGDIVVLGKLPPVKHNELIAHSCLHLLGIHHE